MFRSVASLCVVLAIGCSRESRSGPGPFDASVPEPVLPTPTLTVPAAVTPAWIEALPAAEPTAKKGDFVWAAVPVLPRTGMAEVGLFQVDAVHAGGYSLTDGLGQRVDGVHAALVHQVGETEGFHEDDVALIYTKTTPAMLARVVELVPGAVIKARYDFGGATRVAAVDHAEAPRSGVVPLAFVSFPKSGARSRGLVLALGDDRVWIRTASGHVEIHPVSAVEALPVGGAPHKGARVRAFRWATGFRPGKVVEIIEPGLRYRVRLDGEAAPSDYFFTAVVPAG